MRTSVYDGRLWMVEANFLRYLYYQSTCKRSSSWVHLGIAIRLAQALGLHSKTIKKNLMIQYTLLTEDYGGACLYVIEFLLLTLKDY